jgi:hypothetical protein
MLRIDANHPNHTAAMYHLALVTNLFDASPNFHTALLLTQELYAFRAQSQVLAGTLKPIPTNSQETSTPKASRYL